MKKIYSKLNYFQAKEISRIVHYIEFSIEYVKKMLKEYIKMLFRKNSKLNYPQTLQFPITNKCNLNCIMCNIHGNEKIEIPIEKLSDILNDDIFKKVLSVGINGGEPFIMSDLVERIKIIIETLPELKYLYIISNGTYTTRTVEMLKQIKKICYQRNVILTISFSIDGYGDIHDKIRGVNGTFDKLMQTVTIIQNDKYSFCDYLNFICTITTKNVYELPLLDTFMKTNNLTINYNIATDHERLKNYDKVDDFSLLVDKHARQIASEFLYSKFIETKNAKYFSLFKFLTNNIRTDDCTNLKNSITLTANGDICYCATHSKVLGNVLKEKLNISELYFNNEIYNNTIKDKYCKNCSHYMYGINAKNYKTYIKEKMRSYHKVKL